MTGTRSSLATLPGIAFALLPKVACPACWPAYASLFASLGLGFLLEVRWLFPATAVFLIVAVASLGFRARKRRGLGPFFVGLGASALVLGGKFGFGIDSAMYAGLPLLVGASIWNTRARVGRRPRSGPCGIRSGPPFLDAVHARVPDIPR
jgi:mercuric ion transport protein